MPVPIEPPYSRYPRCPECDRIRPTGEACPDHPDAELRRGTDDAPSEPYSPGALLEDDE